MKKNRTFKKKDVNFRKSQQKQLVAFPKKQFQLIYRERDPSPSSEAFESIIFMKSKKCDNKTRNKQDKIKYKKESNSVSELHKVIRELQKKIKQKQSQKFTIQESSKRQNKLNNNFSLSKQYVKNKQNEQKDKKVVLISTSNKIVNINNTQNLRKNRNIVSPTRMKVQRQKQKQQLSQRMKKQKNQSVKDIKKIKNTSRSTRDYMIKKNSEKNKQQMQEYILIQNQFVFIDKKDEILKNKFLQSTCADFFQSEPYERSKKQKAKIQMNIIDKEVQQIQQIQNDKFENIYSQKKILSKIVKIQKWWKNILNRRKLLHNSINMGNSDIADRKQDNVNISNISEQQSFIFGLNLNQAQSPIKIIDQFSLQKSNIDSLNSLILKQNAAKNQFQSHKTILLKLLNTQKISVQIYSSKIGYIQERYKNHLKQIEQIKTILFKNNSQALQINRQANQDLKIIQKIQKGQIDGNILDQIFGQKIQKTSKQIVQNLMVSRQKSTGCHYQTQKSRPSIYKKSTQTEQQQVYVQDFQQNSDDDDQQIHQIHPQVNMAFNNKEYQQFINQIKQRQQMKAILDRRAAIQMSIIVQNKDQKDNKIGIDTSLNNIHKFLIGFFKFYIFYHKYQFLRLINMPYGYNIDKRIKFLQGNVDLYDQNQNYNLEDDNEVLYGIQKIIPEDIFYQFYQKVYQKNCNNQCKVTKTNLQIQKIHHKALFDSFNQALNVFRPYYQIQGPPYPWINSQKALTFYFIAEQNLQEVFEKTQFKILKWSSNLCGMICQYEKINHDNYCYQKSVQNTLLAYSNHNIVLNEIRQDRQTKCQKLQIEQIKYQWSNFDESRTQICLDVGEYIYQHLLNRQIEIIYLLMKQQCYRQNNQFC